MMEALSHSGSVRRQVPSGTRCFAATGAPGLRRRLVCLLVMGIGLAVAGPSSWARAGEFPPDDAAAWELPEPDLYAVEIRGKLAWAVGYWGSVLRSTDAGETWEYGRTPTTASLYDVAFADELNGWAVGSEGTLLRTTDGGRSWTALQVDVLDPMDGSPRRLDANLFGVSAVSPTEAWAVGDFGMVLHTLDGVSWSQVTIPPEAFADENIPERIFNAVVFEDREHGWIAGEFGTTLRTSDAGETWQGEREFEGAINDLYLFDIAPNGAGWAVAGGVGGAAIGSNDGGSHWSALSVPTTAGLFGAATAGERGLLVGDRGVLLLTRDGGTTWLEPDHPRSFNWLRGVAFGDETFALAAGEGGLILRSVDGGDSWQRVMGHAPPPTSAVSVPEPPRAKPAQRESETR